MKYWKAGVGVSLSSLQNDQVVFLCVVVVVDDDVAFVLEEER